MKRALFGIATLLLMPLWAPLLVVWVLIEMGAHIGKELLELVRGY